MPAFAGMTIVLSRHSLACDAQGLGGMTGRSLAEAPMSDALARISLTGITADNAAQHPAVARAIDASLKALGFFVIADHGVAPALIDDTVAAANRFFDLPTDEKT